MSSRQSYGATGQTASASNSASNGDRPSRTKTRASTSAPATAAGKDSTQANEQPVSKVEPKVWLASERTFFSWIRVALLLGSFAIALFNAGDQIGSTMGAIYALISVFAIIYAWYMHQRRSYRIRTAYPGHFDELFGPLAICILLFAAVLANFIVRIKHHNGKLKTPKSPWLAAYMSYFLDLEDPMVAGDSSITF